LIAASDSEARTSIIASGGDFSLCATTYKLSDSAPIGTLDTEIISTPGRIWRRSRISQVICVLSASWFGKPWQWRLSSGVWAGSKLVGVETSSLWPVITGPVAGDFEAGWSFILGRFHRDSRYCHSFPNRGTDGFELRWVRQRIPAEAVNWRESRAWTLLSYQWRWTPTRRERRRAELLNA